MKRLVKSPRLCGRLQRFSGTPSVSARGLCVSNFVVRPPQGAEQCPGSEEPNVPGQVRRGAPRVCSRRSYAATIETVQEGFRQLAAAVQSLEASCQVQLAAPLIATGPGAEEEATSPACEGFLRSRPGATLAALRVVCQSAMSEEECAACLGDR